ncbi:SH3 domain-binding protein 4 [Ictalurus punctatus]|uniref:SH3 domain-binding protein 4 n=1 Tax=Ictalurus punctatus TaxID=7998 RepID=W5UIJ1_ICTPU|nr:SH3 domain-binding protein 4 [Ictalurus punctatus]XP_017325960.1 SH3 domain-binding protein 4 [Ictalurus punctatus]XP_017325962.1 SH3 domain-binding protein 4 [Ictalurus punctatus]XP_017325963.1 SH3 domain-binding protein 4 [Ictalurus punctatus]XP_017325964.1 SH3 domain-binding protein 4 [Ictalurus punctatus]
MAAHRIRTTNNNNAIPRCKSEGTLIELSSGVSEATLSDVKVPSPSTLRLEATASIEAAREVIAIKDYCPSNFTTLKFCKGDHLYVLDTSGGEWWYAHNNTEMGYIPAAYVQPVTHRESLSCDSGMIDSLGDISNDGSKVLDQRGEWSEHRRPTVPQNGNPFVMKRMSLNPFLDGSLLTDQNSIQSSTDRLGFNISSSPDSKNSSSINFNKFGSNVLDTYCLSPGTEKGPVLRRNNPFYRSKRCYSLSELSILQSQVDAPPEFSGFFNSLKAPTPEQFQSREDFKNAWLNHRKFTRSCHDLDSIGQNPGWGQTQPIETNIVCKLDSSGGAVQLPDTSISILVPEGHVAPDDTQQISLKALLDPPLELNNDKCTTVSPVVEIKLSNMETKTTVTLEMKISVVVKMESRQTAEVICVRSDCKDGPYVPVPHVYMYGDTVQVTLDNLEPCMYVSVVAQAQVVTPYNTVWEHVVKKVALGVYGPKHIHPSFKTVVAMFGHDCAPKTLLVSEAKMQSRCIPPVSLQLWGKHQFVLAKPQDLKVGVYSNISNFDVKISEQTRVVRSFHLKLGKVSHLIYMISARDPDSISDFTLRIQVKDDQDCILAQFCVQTPPPPPKVEASSVQRRFLKKKEMHKSVLSPLIGVTKYPVFHDRPVKNIKFGKLLKTVLRQTKRQYLLEYVKGDVVALLSEEKLKLKGHLWTKEWYIGYYQGRIGLVHAKNILIMGKVKPVNFKGAELTSSVLLDQILIPCKCLTYMYASLRTILMENVNSWRAFADALGYVNLPLAHFCRVEPNGEAEKVACVLEKLKEDCNTSEVKQRKSFQKELLMALLKLDCQGLVAQLLKDFALLTAAVEVADRWRELAEKLAKVSRKQMDSYEAPYRGTDGVIDNEAMWKPAYDFLVTWAAQIGDSYRDILQELHTGLDKMKNPITKHWRHLTGTLILINCLDLLRSTAFSTTPQDDCAV